MRLVFVRHGESLANTIGSLDCEVPGPGLSDLGLHQAKALVQALPQDLDRMPVRAVWASTMLRAQQTAQPYADSLGIPVQVHPLLHEGHVGDLHARVDDEAHQALDDLLAGWLVNGDLDQCRPGGESGTVLVDRMRQVVRDVLAGLGGAGSGGGSGAAVVVSHGAILRVGLPHLCHGVDPAYAMAHHLPNTGRVIVDLSDDGTLVCRTWAGSRLV